MKKGNSWSWKMGAASGRRPRRATVLLIVVVLLLMLAILGVSYLGSTRVDRLASSQDVANASIDQMADNVRDIAVSSIVNGLFAYTANGYQYRGTSNNSVGTYNAFDVPVYNYNNTGDSWLADRVPVLSGQGGQVAGISATPGGLANPSPAWAAISGPLVAQTLPTTATGNFIAAGGAYEFEDPSLSSTPVIAGGNLYNNQFNPYNNPLATGVINPQLPVYPTYKTINVVGGTASHPAFFLQNNNTALLAGDADGDGVADCGLMRLPGVYTDGLTYYAGVRIIDNNSAINLNTAQDWANDPAAAGSTPTYTKSYLYGFFPANVGLNEMLPAGPPILPDYGNLLSFQANNTAVGSTMIEDDGATSVTGGYTWGSQGEMFASQLAHRLGNPGYIAAGVRMQALPLGDQANLAFRSGVFVNPSTVSSTNAPYSVVENLMPNTVAPTLANQIPASTNTYGPITGTTVTQWFNFDFGYTFPAAGATTMPPVANPRPLLVTRNPVSTAAPVSDPDAPYASVPTADMAPYAAPQWQLGVTYYPGDIVSYQPVPTTSADTIYYCKLATGSVRASTNTPPATTANWQIVQAFPTGGPYGVGAVVSYANPTQSVYTFYNAAAQAYQIPITTQVRYYRSTVAANSSTPSPTNAAWHLLTGTAGKTSVNTAPFGELYRAYWNAMTGPNIVPATATSVNPLPATPFGNEGVFLNNSLTSAVMGNGTYTGNTFALGPATVATNSNPPAAGAPPSPTDFKSDTIIHQQRMFRSSLRDPRVVAPGTVGVGFYFPPSQELMLRAALAAVNTLNMRNPGTTNTQTINLTAVFDAGTAGGAATALPVKVRVYGISPQQPYITEVYCDTDITAAGGNTEPYVAIKLYNPSATAITLSNYQIAYILRPNAAPPQDAYHFLAGGGLGPISGFTGLYMDTLVYSLGQNGPPPVKLPAGARPAQTLAVPPAISGISIPGGGYCLLDNLNAHGVNERPNETGLPSSGPPPGMAYAQVNGLTSIVKNGGAELVLLNASNGATLLNSIPVDSFDFTGIVATPTTASAWHYARQDSAAIPSASRWTCVYPGRYNGSLTSLRQQGTQSATWTPTTQTDPWSSPQGTPPTPSGGPFTMSGATTTSTYHSVRSVAGLQNNWPSAAGNKSYPYGAFARDGDILMVPYFGAYTVLDSTGADLLEMNSASMDAAFADDSVPADAPLAYDPTSQLGRFCPTQNDLITYQGSVPAAAPQANGIQGGGTTLTDTNLQAPNTSFYNQNPSAYVAQGWQGWDVLITQVGITPTSQLRHITTWTAPTLTLDSAVMDPTTNVAVTTPQAVKYTLMRPNSWAAHVLDYLTAYTPHDDYLPNVDPVVNSTVVQPVANDNSAIAANSSAEQTVGVDGLININTAPWRVLAALPLAVTTGGVVDPVGSANIAQQIVTDREQYGPFKTIFDLNRVYTTAMSPANPTDPVQRLGFRNGWGNITTTPNTFVGSTAAAQGNIATGAGGGSGIPNQFDETFLQATRLSNLVTTRSDTFTVYIVVEGWQNAGSTNVATPPKLVLTRRAAYIVDRNSVTPASRAVRITEVPNN